MFEKHIRDLLYLHDTVIIPGFGAFVLKYTPASVYPVENKISPPSKHATFDASLKNNDGILANYISEKEKISFIEACNKILVFTEHLNRTLTDEKSLELKEIGKLTMNPDGRIFFSPDNSVNYNLEVYGMETITSPQVLRDDISKRLQKQFSEKKRPVKEKRKGFPKAAVWLLIIVIVLGGTFTALFIFKPDIIKNVDISEIFRWNGNKQNPVLDKTITNPVSSKNKNTKDIAKIDTSVVKKDSSNKINSNDQISEGSFYIISASFRIKENAENYSQTLHNKGFNSKVIFLEEKGMNVVSYNSYKTQADANKDLLKIRNSENPGAWILKN